MRFTVRCLSPVLSELLLAYESDGVAAVRRF